MSDRRDLVASEQRRPRTARPRMRWATPHLNPDQLRTGSHGAISHDRRPAAERTLAIGPSPSQRNWTASSPSPA